MGPFTLDEIKAMMSDGKLLASLDQARVEGTDKWIKVEEIPGFFAPAGQPESSKVTLFPPDPPKPEVKPPFWARSGSKRAFVALAVIGCIVAIIALGPKVGEWLKEDEPPEIVKAPPPEEEEREMPEPADESNATEEVVAGKEGNVTTEPEEPPPPMREFELKVQVTPTNTGSVSDRITRKEIVSENIKEGTDLFLQAASENGWMFLEWQLKNGEKPRGKILNMKMPSEDTLVVARFKPNLARDLFLKELVTPARKVMVAFTENLTDPIEFMPKEAPSILPDSGNVTTTVHWPENPVGRFLAFTEESKPYTTTRTGEKLIFKNAQGTFSVDTKKRVLELAGILREAKGEIPAFRLDFAQGTSPILTLLVFDAGWIQRNGSRIVVSGQPKLKGPAFYLPHGWTFHSRRKCRILNERYNQYWVSMIQATSAVRIIAEHPGHRNLTVRTKTIFKSYLERFTPMNPNGPLPYLRISLPTKERICTELQQMLEDNREGDPLKAMNALHALADDLKRPKNPEFHRFPNAARYMHEMIRGYLDNLAKARFQPQDNYFHRLDPIKYLNEFPLREAEIIKDTVLPAGIAQDVNHWVQKYNSGNFTTRATARAKLALHGVSLAPSKKVTRLEPGLALAAAKIYHGRKLYLQLKKAIASIKAKAERIDLDTPFRKSTWSTMEFEAWKNALAEIEESLERAAGVESPEESTWSLGAGPTDYKHLVWR